MKHLLALALVSIGFGGFLALQSLQPAHADGPYVALLAIDGIIDPVTADFLARGIQESSENGAGLLIVSLDTPGGLLDSTREMVEEILASPLPVVVYVSPQGAQAASAGTFITAAGHVAAMAPISNIGAASPVGPGGADLPDTIKSKATEDAAAFIRSIAEQRGRNADALEETVLEATSYSSTEALEQNIVDLLAEDLDDLLAQLQGREVTLASGNVILDTEGLEVRTIERTAVESFLGFLASPDIAFLLLSIGGLGILVEIMNPGLAVPGIAGVIALALAFVALGNLPVNWTGVGLIGLAMLLFFLEAQAPGIGAFGIAGGVSFVLGAFLLFGGFSPRAIDTPSFGVSIWLIVVISGILFGAVATFVWLVRQAKGAAVSSETQSLVGQTGTTTTPLSPRGVVEVADERWSAVSDSGESIDQGEEVIVLEVDGVMLKVFKPDI